MLDRVLQVRNVWHSSTWVSGLDTAFETVHILYPTSCIRIISDKSNRWATKQIRHFYGNKPVIFINVDAAPCSVHLFSCL